MPPRQNPELLLLHALPLDGSMWAGQMALLPGATYAPTLYALGDSIEEWAAEALKLVRGDRLIVVGCSVGGSCALELAAAAPDRVAALVLIGTKAGHRPDPALHACALETIQQKGLEEAWRRFLGSAVFPFCRQPSGERREAHRASAVAAGRRARCDGFPQQSRARAVPVVVSAPGRVVTGADDSAPGLEVSAAQARSAQQGRLHIVPACGHYVPLERPES